MFAGERISATDRWTVTLPTRRFKGSKRVKGKETERGGSVRKVSMVTVTSPEARACLPQWEFCLRGGEGKQQSPEDRRRHFVKFKWQKRGSQRGQSGKLGFFSPFFFFYSPPAAVAPIPLHLPVVGGCWNTSALRQCAINTGWMCGGELYAPVSPVIFNWAITMRDRKVEKGEREGIEGACSLKHHCKWMSFFLLSAVSCI